VAPEEAGAVLRMAATVNLFELGQLSSGAAARLAGVPRAVFLSRLADYGVDTFRLTEEQFQRETRIADVICNISGIARCQARRSHTGSWPVLESVASIALSRGAAYSRCRSQTGRRIDSGALAGSVRTNL